MAFCICAPKIKATYPKLFYCGHLILIAWQMKFFVMAESNPTSLSNVLQPLIIRSFWAKKLLFPVPAGNAQFRLFSVVMNDF